MSHHLLERLLGNGESDPGCEASFAAMEQYVETILRGDDVTLAFPGMVIHLQNCSACREDTEGLLAALREIEPG